MITLEEINENIQKVSDEINLKIEELDKLTEQYYELSPEYIQVECPSCLGKTFIQQQDNKVICKDCGGNGYIWMKGWYK